MQYPNDFINKIINGDCLEVMKSIPDKSIAMVLTDPPYGIGKDYGNNSDEMFNKEWFEEAKRVSHGMGFTPGIVNMFKFPQPDWVMCWYKPGAMSRTKYGFNSGEPILIYDLPPSTKEPDVIRSPITFQKEVGNHPTPKPIELFKKMVLRFTKPGDVVLDPFLGSGTTAKACHELGRNYIGIEINPDYCKIAEQRLKQQVLL